MRSSSLIFFKSSPAEIYLIISFSRAAVFLKAVKVVKMILRAKINLSDPEERQEMISILKKDGNIVETSRRDSSVFVTLTKGITRSDAFYIPEQIQEMAYEIMLKTEEMLPYEGIASVVCGAKSAKPLRPYWLQKDQVNDQIFAAHFNVPKSVAFVNASSAGIEVILCEVLEGDGFASLKTTTPFKGDAGEAGQYCPPAKAALMKLRGQEGVCYYAPKALDFFDAFRR
ncbi:MAG: hypothetical protein PHW52_00030 [Candidatus Pacebacteria bacterium]|nr:hypothetical protein [Candidatus Paceibacterota bacterium]